MKIETITAIQNLEKVIAEKGDVDTDDIQAIVDSLRELDEVIQEARARLIGSFNLDPNTSLLAAVEHAQNLARATLDAPAPFRGVGADVAVPATDAEIAGLNPSDDDNHIIKYPQYQKMVAVPMIESFSLQGKPYAIVIIDTYDVSRAFGITNTAQDHAIKKILRAGKDHNDFETDMEETKDSIDKAILNDNLARVTSGINLGPLRAPAKRVEELIEGDSTRVA